MRMRLGTDGVRLLAADRVVGICDDPGVASHIANSVNSVDDIAADLENLLIAAGLDYARDWSPHEAFEEVRRQINMIRRTMATSSGRMSGAHT